MKRVLFTAMAIMMVSAPLAAQQHGNMAPGQMFLKQLDTNGDKSVSMDEFLKPYQMQFGHMDANKDGGVSGAEAEAFMKKMRERMMQMQKQRQK